MIFNFDCNIFTINLELTQKLLDESPQSPTTEIQAFPPTATIVKFRPRGRELVASSVKVAISGSGVAAAARGELPELPRKRDSGITPDNTVDCRISPHYELLRRVEKDVLG